VDDEIKQLLDKNVKLSEENNQLLLKLYKIQRWAQITRVIYWFLIIGITGGAFYFIKPYLGNMLNLYTGGVSGIGNVSSIKETLNSQTEIQDLLKSLNE